MPTVKPKVVIILGAGASQDAGAPLMNNFLDVAERLVWSGKLNAEDQRSFEAVFQSMEPLQAVYAKSYLELGNIEAVFAALEMAELLDITLCEDPAISLTEAIRRLIVVTLEKSIRFPVQDGDVSTTKNYAIFAESISKILQAYDIDITVITFNYDVALDIALRYYNIPCAYYLTEDTPSDALPLLKLHGSLNWTYCPHCQKALAWHWSPTLNELVRLGVPRAKGTSSSDIEIPITSLLQSGLRHTCSQALTSPQPLIVPPTWNKGEHHEQIKPVWQKAARDLMEASVIAVCGYSLPETDYFFRYLFALGTMGPSRLKRFVVFDPNISDVSPRYERLLGPLTKQRFETIKWPFLNFAVNLASYTRVP